MSGDWNRDASHAENGKEDKVTEKARVKMLQDASAMMDQLNIKEQEPVMARVKEPGTLGVPNVPIQTNIFGLRIKDIKTAVYRYDVMIWAPMGTKVLELTKKTRDDFNASDRMLKSVTVLGMAIDENPQVFGQNNCRYFYDGQSILYCLTQINFPDKEKPYFETVFKVTDHSLLGTLSDLHFAVKPVKDDFQMTLADLKKSTNDLRAGKDRSALQFADIITSMSAVSKLDRFVVFPNGKIFLRRPWEEGFNERDCPDLGEGKRLMVGVNKAVRMIEGPKGRGSTSPAVVIDSLKAAFHVKQLVMDKFIAITKIDNFDRPVPPSEIERAATVMKGLTFRPTYGKHKKPHMICGISRETALKTIEVASGGTMSKMTIQEYYQQKCPNAPLVISKVKGMPALFPMELCLIEPMQRVTIPQTSSAQSQATTRACAVLPIVRQKAIRDQVVKMNLVGQQPNPFLEQANLELVPNPFQISGRNLPLPRIMYGGTHATPESKRAWKTPPNARFSRPAEVCTWGLYAINGGGRDQMDLRTLEEFGRRFIGECQKRGMKLSFPAEHLVLVPEKPEQKFEELIENRIRLAADHNCQFAFFVTSDSIHAHKSLKMSERRHGVITQDMKMSNAIKVVRENKFQTLENVVLKTNMKMGGLNYTLDTSKVNNGSDPLRHSRLIIGITVSHPPPTGAHFDSKGIKVVAPSVIGFACNFLEKPTEYAGDFTFLETNREEILTVFPDIIKRGIMKQYLENVKAPPEEVWIYRGGVGEGSFAEMIKKEIPLIRHAFKEAGAPNVKVVYIVAQKEHNVRLMNKVLRPEDKAPAQNIGVGVVVDSLITHPQRKEFYLNSHITLQGSARTPRYTVLVDDADLPMDELEAVTISLAHNHQIVNLPTSLPAPLYIATRYAERGRDLLSLREADDKSSSDSIHRFNLGKLMAEVSYTGTRLTQKRLNA